MSYQQIAQLERTLDDQAKIIRQLCRAVRLTYAEMRHDQGYDHIKPILENAYPGGKKSLRLSIKGTKKRSD